MSGPHAEVGKNKLQSLREKITVLDQEIIRLLGTRHRHVLAVAGIKQEHGLPIRDEEREKLLLDILVTTAEKEGLSSDYVRSIYKLVIDKSVSEQQQQNKLSF